MTRIRPNALLVVLLLVPAAWGLPAGVLGDAGSENDAGSTPDSAMALAYGRYHGNRTPADVDWFAFPAGPTVGCLDAEVLSSHAMAIAVGVGGTTLPGGLTEGVFATTLAVEPGPLRLGVLPDVFPWEAASLGPYSFAFSVAAPSVVGDSNQNDAPPTPAGAPLAPADCFRGHFRADGNDTDVFRFAAAPGDIVTFSLAQDGGAGASVRIMDGANQPISPRVEAGDVGQIQVTQAGIYYVTAKSEDATASSSYALAVVAGPEPSGCRPYCLGLQ